MEQESTRTAMATQQPSYPGMPYNWIKQLTINPPSPQKQFSVPLPQLPPDFDFYQLRLPTVEEVGTEPEPERPAGEVVKPVWDGKWPTPPEMTAEETLQHTLDGLRAFALLRAWDNNKLTQGKFEHINRICKELGLEPYESIEAVRQKRESYLAQLREENARRNSPR